MDGVLSGKTGYTSKAGYCYVAALEKDGERYCIALLACGWPNNKTYKWKDATKLFSYGLENYEKVQVKSREIKESIETEGYIPGGKVGEIYKTVQVTCSGVYDTFSLLVKEGETIRTETVLYDTVTLPVQKGEVLGEGVIYLEDEVVKRFFLYAESDCRKWNVGEIFKRILWQFLTFS
jgi:D-alanyl-D-alanine carboxypeptidase (penicillin-binding protein 5/6)